MKILMPYRSYSGDTLESKLIIGGIELFMKKFYSTMKHCEVIPFYFTDEDARKRKILNKLLKKTNECRPDLIFTNYDTRSLNIRILEKTGIPTLWLTQGMGYGLSALGTVQIMDEFTRKGGTLFMLSKKQYDVYNDLFRRVYNGETDLVFHGYLEDSYCDGTEEPNKSPLYNGITIGRCDPMKDPFWLYRKLGKRIENLAMCTSLIPDLIVGSKFDYYNKHSEWHNHKFLFKNLHHSEVMDILAKSRVYFSTWAEESWGITALEALSRGLPVIMVTSGKDNIHASESIAASPRHYIKVRKGINREDLQDQFENLLVRSYSDRLLISDLTKEKHSRERWIKKIDAAMQTTLESINSTTRVTDFI